MPLFVHLAPEPYAKRIRRSGIRATRVRHRSEIADRLVWAFPVIESFPLTYQWARELKRIGAHTLVAVTFRIPDEEPVYVHHYNAPPVRASAAEAVAFIRRMEDARGGEVMIPRRIEPDEIVHVRPLRRTFGWRYAPQAKDGERRPCDCPMCAPQGEVKAKRYRDRIPLLMRRWDEKQDAKR